MNESGEMKARGGAWTRGSAAFLVRSCEIGRRAARQLPPEHTDTDQAGADAETRQTARSQPPRAPLRASPPARSTCAHRGRPEGHHRKRLTDARRSRHVTPLETPRRQVQGPRKRHGNCLSWVLTHPDLPVFEAQGDYSPQARTRRHHPFHHPHNHGHHHHQRKRARRVRARTRRAAAAAAAHRGSDNAPVGQVRVRAVALPRVSIRAPVLLDPLGRYPTHTTARVRARLPLLVVAPVHTLRVAARSSHPGHPRQTSGATPPAGKVLLVVPSSARAWGT